MRAGGKPGLCPSTRWPYCTADLTPSTRLHKVRGCFVLPGGTVPVITHQSPCGALDVPSVYRGGDNPWLAGEEVEVTDEQARGFLAQHELFFPVDDAAKAITAELTDEPAEDEPEPTPEPESPTPPVDDPKDE